MRKKLGFCLGGILILAGLIFFTASYFDKPLEEKIYADFARKTNLSPVELTSSNPYDYINQKYYDKVVGLGVPAIAVIEDKYWNSEIGGLDAYLAGVAIEEIADMHLSACTGEGWASAPVFFWEWNKAIEALPNTFYEIINSEDDLDEKINRIEKYGVFGQAILNSISSTEEDELDYFGTNIRIDDGLKKRAKEVPTLPAKEMREINEYLEAKVI